VSAAQLDAQAGVLELIQPRPPPTDRADYFHRPTNSHWLLPWLELLLSRLTMQHVMVQMLLGVLYAVVGWTTFSWARHVPALLAFAHQIYYQA
jgi:hypothetical protein